LTDSAAVVPPRIDASEVDRLTREFEEYSAEEVLRWAVERFGEGVALSTSFQATGMVLLDMLSRISPDTRIFTLDTGRLPKETYDLIDAAQLRYGCSIDIQSPDPDELKEIVGQHGMNMFYRSYSLRLLCCETRKVKPLNRALTGLDAWFTGLMRSQGGVRSEIAKIAIDTGREGRVKISPLADWDIERVWDYIRTNDVPYNALYDRGYTSIGCDPCTRAIEPGEDTRAGRWWWESGVPKECGIHLTPDMKAQALQQASLAQATTDTSNK
jgi:phosphoadenosine phosphosulfate reductase